MFAIAFTTHNEQKKVEPTVLKFEGGEVQITWPMAAFRAASSIEIHAAILNSDDVMSLLLGVDAIRRNTLHAPRITLQLPYFPYARQDRVCAEGQALSVVVMANLINSMELDEITICDPHSDVTPALIKNVRIVNQASLIPRFRPLRKALSHKDTVIVAPDAGASKKAASVAGATDRCTPVVQALKQRNAVNGAIEETRLLGDVKGKVCIIVDDICDGGRTFIALADELRKSGAKEVHLSVTHGIFSRGLVALEGLIDVIYTTDSFPSSAITSPNTTNIELHVQTLGNVL